jgi:hypothetical protein
MTEFWRGVRIPVRITPTPAAVNTASNAVQKEDRRNAARLGPASRRGAGSIPAGFRIFHTVDGATLIPRPASSPRILRYPHDGFSRVIRGTSALMSR